MKNFLLILFLFFILNYKSQYTLNHVDTINRSRIIGVTTAVSSLSVSSLIYLQSVWYSAYPSSSFHFFDDSKSWLGMDKIGHVYTCYSLSNIVNSMYSWSGLKRKSSVIIASSFAWSYQLILELMDGKSSAWGFSMSDLFSNTIGATSFCLQEIVLNRQVFQLKFSYYPSIYPKYRPEILGKTWNEKILKDYNGQIYWLTFSPFEFTRSKKLSYLQLSLGYSVDSKIIGDKNVFIDGKGNNFYAKKEFLLGLDIRVSKLPIKKKWIKNILYPFEYIKIPLPALLWRNNICYFGVF